MQINTSITNGITYYQMTNRGTDYWLRSHNNGWELTSERQNFAGMPRTRFYKNLSQLEQEIKAFRGISSVIH